MPTIYSISGDGLERYDSVLDANVAKTIKILQRKGQLNIRVIPKPVAKEIIFPDDHDHLVDEARDNNNQY